MQNAINSHPDYLVIGPITEDVIDGGFTHGGTASYASLTASAFDLSPAILTAGCFDIQHLPALHSMQIHQKPSKVNTKFRNIETPAGRQQYLLGSVDHILPEDVPSHFLTSKIVHLGPMAQETDPAIIELFPDAFIGVTPQGWMRKWDEQGLVSYTPWKPSINFVNRVNAVVFSIEDVEGDEEVISELARKLEILAVTEGYNGARVYWNGDVRRFSAPLVDVQDPTGAGDIFSAIFFIRLHATRDPWSSASLAVELASLSVSRQGLQSIPTRQEINTAMVDLLKGS